MIVTSSAIKGGYFDDKYGKRGSEIINKVPVLSFPFTIKDAPEGTKSYAWVLEDEDAVPVVGFSWIHWMAVNDKLKKVPENMSRENTSLVQGKNSWGRLGYGGMTPPNATHRYDLHVYALDTELDLQSGFKIEDLYRAIGSHILDSYTLSGKYSN